MQKNNIDLDYQDEDINKEFQASKKSKLIYFIIKIIIERLRDQKKTSEYNYEIDFAEDGLTQFERERRKMFKRDIDKIKQFNVNKLVEEYEKLTGPIKIDKTLEELIRIQENRMNGYFKYIDGYRDKTGRMRENLNRRIQVKNNLEQGIYYLYY